MEISFAPSPDVAVVLNALLDILERRATEHTTYHPEAQRSGRSIKIVLADILLPAYFSQTDPTPRLTANEQFTALEKAGLLKLAWLSGETGHILQSAQLERENPERARAGVTRIYALIHRSAKTDQRTRLETLLLADKFRFVDDWRARAIRHILTQLRAGKSPSPFNLSDSGLTIDLLTVMEALPTLTTETPYRVFSVRVFNDSKRLEVIKNQLVSLARLGNPEWKRIPAEEVLRELNLVANPNYIHLAGNWQLTLETGEILSIGGFSPSIGFPAAQTAGLQSVEIHADAVLCIENITTFHEFIRAQTAALKRNAQHIIPERGGVDEIDIACSMFRFAVICTYGNPSPAVRRLLRLIPDSTPIYHWSDLDYGGFNILSQLRRLVSERVEPYRMDIVTFDDNFERARPLTASDRANLKKLLQRSELRDVRLVIEHLLKRGLKLEQEGVENG